MHCFALSLVVSFLARLVSGVHIEVVTNSNNPGELGLCQGDCDIDEHCADGLVCFQRNENEPIDGCSGGLEDNSRTDYCVPATLTTSPTSLPTRQIPVPKVWPPTNAAPVAIIFNPDSLPALITYGSSPPASRLPLGRCEGDCDVDDHCSPGLVCFQRNENEPVPGCAWGNADNSRTDYCVPKAGFPRNPTPQTLPSLSPTKSPTVLVPTYNAPVTNMNPLPALISFGSNPPPSQRPLQLCQGDCDGGKKDEMESIPCYLPLTFFVSFRLRLPAWFDLLP